MTTDLDRTYGGNGPTLGVPLMADLIKDLRKYASVPRKRIPTGITSLDLFIKGPSSGEVAVILGRSYTGKSMVLHNIITNNPDHPCLFFSMEMSSNQAVERLLTAWSGLEHSEVLRQVEENQLGPELEAMADALDAVTIVDRNGLGFGDFSAYVAAYEATFGFRPDYVMFDYMELIRSDGDSGGKVEEIARDMKAWAKAEKMPVYVVHQANMKEEPWEPPTQNSARYAGFTEADLLVGVWVPGLDPELSSNEWTGLHGVFRFNVLKNRVNGQHPRGAIEARLDSSLRFQDLSVIGVTDGGRT